MPTLPFGTWPSPVTADLLTATPSPAAPYLDDTWLWWTVADPADGGRSSLWRRVVSGDDDAEEITPGDWDVRTRVHEYGGGAYAVAGVLVVISHAGDGRLYLFEPGQQPRPLTAAGSDVRFADLRILQRHRLVVAVREDHRGPEPINTIVAIPLDGPADGHGDVLCAGADFYASPQISTDDRIAWCEWDHPSMPWDATRIMVGGFRHGPNGVPVVTDPFAIAGSDDESAIHPRWIPGEGLLYLTDVDGFWNLHHWSDDEHGPLLTRAADFCGPSWQLGLDPYSIVDGETVVCSWWIDGTARIGTIDLTTGDLTEFETPAVSVGALVGSAGRCAALVQHSHRSPALVVLDLETEQWNVLHRVVTPVDEDVISAATAVQWRNHDHEVYGWWWKPHLPHHQAPDGELPPLRVMCHGGPTAHVTAALDLQVQYWTTRGYAVLAVNYSGSTGYGREYRQRLRGQWGVLDVQDSISGARDLIARGWVDPERVSIEGSSAGGFTALQALTHSSFFAAGISRFGVVDPTMLAHDTHKFESRYLDSLIGPYPDAAETYRERSPLVHAQRITAPLLLVQGAQDRVVPLNQAVSLAEAAAEAGVQHVLKVFADEGHGFRQAQSVISAIQAEEAFLAAVYGFTPAGDLAPIVLS